MQNKIKNIIFYCIASVFLISVIIGSIIDAINGDGNLVISIIVAVSAIGLFILSSFELYSVISCDKALNKLHSDETKETDNKEK